MTGDYPECERLAAVASKSQEIGFFLDSCGYTLCELDGHDDYHPVRKTIEQMLAEHFNIDLQLVEREKRTILDNIRNADQGG